jgi:hypothetical protein
MRGKIPTATPSILDNAQFNGVALQVGLTIAMKMIGDGENDRRAVPGKTKDDSMCILSIVLFYVVLPISFTSFTYLFFIMTSAEQ